MLFVFMGETNVEIPYILERKIILLKIKRVKMKKTEYKPSSPHCYSLKVLLITLVLKFLAFWCFYNKLMVRNFKC